MGARLRRFIRGTLSVLLGVRFWEAGGTSVDFLVVSCVEEPVCISEEPVCISEEAVCVAEEAVSVDPIATVSGMGTTFPAVAMTGCFIGAVSVPSLACATSVLSSVVCFSISDAAEPSL